MRCCSTCSLQCSQTRSIELTKVKSSQMLFRLLTFEFLDAALVWKFQRYDLLKTYHARSPLIPPFNLIFLPLNLIYKLVRLVSRRFCHVSDNLELRMPIKIPYSGKESSRRKSTSYEKFQQQQQHQKRNVRDGIEMTTAQRIPLLNKFMGSTDQLNNTANKGKTLLQKQNKLTIFENIAFDMINTKLEQ